MSDIERLQVLELRRSRLLDDGPRGLQVSHGPHFIREGNKFIAARRTITLVLIQIKGTHTTAKLTRTLSIKTDSTRADIGDATESAEKIKSAREEANAVLSVLGHCTFKILHVEAPEYFFMSDPPGLLRIGGHVGTEWCVSNKE